MSIGSFLHKITASHGNDLTKGAQAAAQQTEIGNAITSAIAAAKQSGVPNDQKIVQATAAVAPVVADLATKHGLNIVKTDAETFARIAIENELASQKQTGPALIGALVLQLLSKQA